MIGLVIADDEPLIRQGLAGMPWSDIGIELRGIASNGMEALELLKSTGSNIILTDIRMPVLDGIDLIRIIREELPDIKTILLTGYQEFDYAYSAIKHGASGFILKPTDPDEIMKIVNRVKQELETNNKDKEKQSVLIEKFLLDLLYGKTPPERELEEWNNLKPGISDYVVMVIEINTSGKNNEESLQKNYLLLQEANNVINNISTLSDNHTIIVNSTMLGLIACISSQGNNIKNDMVQMAEQIEKVIKSSLKTPVTIGISNSSRKIEELNKLFSEAVYCLNMKFAYGKGHVIHKEDMIADRELSGYLPAEAIHEIVDNVKISNYRKVEDLTCGVLNCLSKRQNANDLLLKYVSVEIITSALNAVVQNGIEIFGMQERLDFYNNINACRNIDELIGFTNNLLIKMMDSLNFKDEVIINKTVDECLSYISRHYMDNITLVSVAQHIHRSPIYLSRLIKKVHGKNFSEILTWVRMNKACELLKMPDIKSYEVSDKVGIKDSRYFSQVFKKNFGVTPTEFRNNILLKHSQNTENHHESL